jgi:hypothetical protein
MLKVRFAVVVLTVCLTACFLLQEADAVELRYDSGTADDYTFQLTDGYLIRFTAPDFVESFVTGISFFGNRFGSFNGAKPPTGYIAILDIDYNKIASREISFSDVSTAPSWNHFSIDPFVVKGSFWIYILMPSSPYNGVMMGKDLDPTSLRSRVGNHASGFKPISDGRYNWMIRCDVSDGAALNSTYTSDTLKGDKFIYKDNGISSGFATLYRYGATLKLDAPTAITLSKLYVYGKLVGDWYNTEREFTVYILDADLRIVLSCNYPYRVFSSQASWSSIDIPDTRVSGKYYIVIEPTCRDDVQLELGYDSAPNKSSLFTAMGQPKDWPFTDIDLTKLNWMFRVETA